MKDEPKGKSPTPKLKHPILTTSTIWVCIWTASITPPQGYQPTYPSISGCPTGGYWDLQCLSSFGVVVSSMGSFSPTSNRIFVAWLEWRVITIDGIRKVLVSFLLVFLNSSVLRGCSVIVQAWDINSRLFLDNGSRRCLAWACVPVPKG